jgi:transposase InsO family protein
MVWQEKNTVSLRQEFVEMARQDGANMRALCRRFEISPKTGYKWLTRFEQGLAMHGPAGVDLHDRSRRPLACPSRSAPEVEQAVVALRQLHPAWGGRKIARCLSTRGEAALAPSTVTRILHRHGLISEQAHLQHQPWQRFEHDTPNSLWQIDFKGHFPTLNGPCHALTLLDDHSRFNLALHAGTRTATECVQPVLERVFQRYGLPVRINADNGPPWGSPSGAGHSLSELAIWLIRLGVRVSFSAPYHPQTNGKIERFHRSLKDEVLAGRHFVDHDSVQRAFDPWRDIYNCVRPHEALEMSCPVQRYQPSALAYRSSLLPIEYPSTDTVITVGWNGFIRFRGYKLRTSTALHRLPIAIRPDPGCDGCYDLYFCHQRFMTIDLREPSVHT